MSANKILQFRGCPACNRPCANADLSMCLRCGQEYCSRCSWECECDRVAREVLERGTVHTHSIFQSLRLWVTGLMGVSQ